MEEHCREPGSARGDYVIVAQALSQVKSFPFSFGFLTSTTVRLLIVLFYRAPA